MTNCVIERNSNRCFIIIECEFVMNTLLMTLTYVPITLEFRWIIRKATSKLKYLRAKRDEYIFIRKMFHFFSHIYYVVPFIRIMDFQCLWACFKLLKCIWPLQCFMDNNCIVFHRNSMVRCGFHQFFFLKSSHEHETWPMPFTICTFHHLESCTIDLLSSSNDDNKQMIKIYRKLKIEIKSQSKSVAVKCSLGTTICVLGVVESLESLV